MSEEDALQIAAATLLRLGLSDSVVWWHTPNGGSRNKREAVKLKRMGARAGVPDLAFILPDGRAAFIELKAKGGRAIDGRKTRPGRLSTEQETFRDDAQASGALWALARSVDDVQTILTGWGLPLSIKLDGRV